MNIRGVWNRSKLLLVIGGAAASALALSACATRPASGPAAPSSDLAAIERDLAAHISILASDAFEGRAPGTAGESKTLDYLLTQWQKAGLEGGTNKPANPWLAPVSIASSIPDQSVVRFRRRGRQINLPEGSAIAYSSGLRALLDNAPVLFVGKQYRELDRAELTGRVAVMLWDHSQQAEQREELLERGASAVLAIVARDSDMAALVSNRAKGAYRLADDADGGFLDGFLTAAAADTILGEGLLAVLSDAAQSPAFKPVPLPVSVSIETTAIARQIASHNLIGRLPGRRPDLGAVVLMAHWDHFGVCAVPPAQDLICNGAVDNASGLAVLTEIGRRLAAGQKLDRDVYFVATTAEETGLLGARAFAGDPPVPLNSIVAAFNVDSIAIAPRGAPVAIVGAGLTRLDGPIEQLIARQGRKLGDARFAANFLRRQDGWVLLQRDVPTLMVSSAFADRAAMDPYVTGRYHLASDESGAVELGGAAQDLLLHLDMIRFFADASLYAPVQTADPNAPPA